MTQITHKPELCCALRQKLGVRDILAVDLAQPALDALAEHFPPPGALGNEPGVGMQLACSSCWLTDSWRCMHAPTAPNACTVDKLDKFVPWTETTGIDPFHDLRVSVASAFLSSDVHLHLHACCCVGCLTPGLLLAQ